MRKAVLLFATIALALVVAGGVALAATPIQCQVGVACKGTNADDAITGTTSADSITGLRGNDTVTALAGKDKIDGGANNDTMDGGDGNDSYRLSDKIAPPGSDHISADSSGVDTIDFSRLIVPTGGIFFNITGPTPACDPASPACLSLGGNFIENLIGTKYNDDFFGNTLKNKLTGGLGNDGLDGQEGNDQLLGSDGDDLLLGFTGNDKLTASAGTDNMFGEAGKDTMDGGPGNDRVDGGDGTGTGVDDADVVNGGDGDDLVFGDPGDDTVNGDLNNDQLYGQEGNDQLHGSDGADALLGGTGNDTMDGGLGDDDHFFNGNWGSETVIDAGGTDSIRANNAPAPPSVTINLASGTDPEVTDGTNSFNWSSNVIEDAFLGPGNDQVSQNSSSNAMADFAGGSDTYKGYGPGGPASGSDIIGDLTGSSGDRLDLSNFNTSQVTLLFGDSGPGTPATGLIIKFADGSRIDIDSYFDGTSTGCLVGPGDGLIETITFANEPNVGFARAKQLIGCSTTASAPASSTSVTFTDSAQADQLQVGNLKDEQTAPAPPRPSVATDASTYQKR